MHAYLTVVDPPDLAGQHGHDQQIAVRQPPEPRWSLVAHVDHGLTGPVGRYRVDPMLVEVAVPESPLVPTRAFAEVQSVDQQGGFVHRSLRPRGRRESRFTGDPDLRRAGPPESESEPLSVDVGEPTDHFADIATGDNGLVMFDD